MFKKPIIRRFTWDDGSAPQNENGLDGWVMKGFEDLDPTSGFGVAHDAMEHFDATLGPDAEMMAFGAIVWGRGDSGWSFGRHGMNDALVSDIQRFFEDGMEWCKPIPTRPLRDSEFSVAAWAEDTLSDFRRCLIKGLLEPYDNDNEPILRGSIEANMRADHMVQWMRRGMKRTERRWKHAGEQQAFMSCFHQLENDSNVSGKDRAPGDILIVKIHGGYKGVDTRIQSIYDDYRGD